MKTARVFFLGTPYSTTTFSKKTKLGEVEFTMTLGLELIL